MLGLKDGKYSARIQVDVHLGINVGSLSGSDIEAEEYSR